MDNTSDQQKPGFDPYEQVTPFFNRAQLKAFAQPPTRDAIKKLNSAGSHDYLPHEYIRALLDRYIGAGLWAARSALADTVEETIDKNNKTNIAITAVVNVELEILSRTDPDKRLIYAGIGTHTMEAESSKGKGKTLANAISSAESKGIKSAAQNLGRAFGFDLANKLNRDSLPPTLAEYGRQLKEDYDRKMARAGAAPAQITHQPSEDVVVNPTDAPQEPMAQAKRPESAAKQQERQAAQPQRDDRPVDAPAAENVASQEKPSAPAEPAAQQDSNAEKQATASAEPAQGASGNATQDFVPWELGMNPGDSYENWVRCIRTMHARIATMTSAREIENFLRRHKKLIDDFPIFTDPTRDFKARFRRIVAQRYTELNLEIPEQYRDAAA